MNKGIQTSGNMTAVRSAIFIAVFALAPFETSGESIVNSKHNLSAGGPGSVKSPNEQEVCIFCHATHATTGDAPLWNRNSSGKVYNTYRSTTSKANNKQPTGSSKVCLGCHDGTVALGMVRSRRNKIKMKGNTDTMPHGRSNLGTDLADDHPISFTFDDELKNRSSGKLINPATLRKHVKLDHNREMQCTSCHDAHDNRNGQFLVMNNYASALCLSCHVIDYWETSSHSSSGAVWSGAGEDPWPHTKETTVIGNGCENCHTPHNAGSKQRLLNFDGEENNCYPCHNGNVAKSNIQAEFKKMSVHPVETTRGVHDPVEDLKNSNRHATCVDCHSPHASSSSTAKAPDAAGAIRYVKGVSASGSPVDKVTMEYELCFRCHADSENRASVSRIRRQTPETNTRLEFNSANASYHPVTAAGKNGDVPSLISPLTSSSMIYCTDCHNNDQGPAESGNGPKGPHGSAYAPLLARQLVFTDYSPESQAAYALCYKCHSRSSILGDESFPHHKKHLEFTACTTCHDPHASKDSSNLINFNREYVGPYNGRIEFLDIGVRKGSCSLTCHNHDHNAATY